MTACPSLWGNALATDGKGDSLSWFLAERVTLTTRGHPGNMAKLVKLGSNALGVSPTSLGSCSITLFLGYLWFHGYPWSLRLPEYRLLLGMALKSPKSPQIALCSAFIFALKGLGFSPNQRSKTRPSLSRDSVFGYHVGLAFKALPICKRKGVQDVTFFRVTCGSTASRLCGVSRCLVVAIGGATVA